MAFNRPTLSEIVERIAADISTRVAGSASTLRRSVIRILATAFGGAIHLAYGYLDYVSRMAFATTAEDEFLGRIADFYGVARNPATYAGGPIDMTGTNGTIIPSGTLLQTADGVQYSTDADGTISGGTVEINVTCETEGVIGNLVSGETMTLVSPISGANSEATVSSEGISGGADEEDDESLRARLLERIQNPPMGGAEADYIAWAKEVTGVTRVWVNPEQYGAGTVGVVFVRDDDTGSIIPDSNEIQDVQDYIDERRPVTADVTVLGPTAVPVNFTIDLGATDTAAIREAVEAELADLILRKAEPGGTIYLSQFREAISTAAGEQNHTMTVPSADVTQTLTQIATMGTVTFT